MEQSDSGVNQQEIGLTKEECAYIAGLLDGEGTFHCIWRSARKPRLVNRQVSSEVSIATTSKDLIEYLDLVFTRGHIGHYISSKDRKPGIWREIYQIHISGFKRVQKFLPLVIPYLVIKRELAEKTLLLCDVRLRKGRGKRYDREDMEILLEIDSLQERGRYRKGQTTKLRREITEILRDYTRGSLTVDSRYSPNS